MLAGELLNVDLDVVLSVLAHTILRRAAPPPARLPRGHPRLLQRRFLNTGGIEHDRGQTTIQRPVHLADPATGQPARSELRPWWDGRDPPLPVRLTRRGRVSEKWR